MPALVNNLWTIAQVKFHFIFNPFALQMAEELQPKYFAGIINDTCDRRRVTGWHTWRP
jgi:hypothetical protein